MNTKQLTADASTMKEDSRYHQIIGLLKTPILIGLLITPVRFTLELVGLPEYAIFFIGALWITLALSIFWGVKLHQAKQSFKKLLLCLAIFSPISRIPIAILWWVDNHWELGSHYGHYFDNFASALANHLAYGSLIQVVPGFILGSMTILIMQKRKTSEK